jgi:hypothetical protein
LKLVRHQYTLDLSENLEEGLVLALDSFSY